MYKLFWQFIAVSMASSSSCPSHIKIKVDPIDSDVLWMQPKHVSEHLECRRRSEITYQTSCPYVSRGRKNFRANFSFSSTIWFRLDYQDGILKNKCLVN